ncbi:MAG TPA: M23 family metallopeptidase [Cyclobacteriaceae bacterium]|nr:M23 family metallopeptidase [Cyclobacteriaceae bacterium]
MKVALLLFLVIESSVLYGQTFEKQELITFGSRIDNPVTMEVIRTKDVLSFYADNKSIYPYRLELEFTMFRNLTPMKSTEQFVLHSGRNLLFKLTIVEPTQSPGYSYSIRYRMGNPDEKADENFSYLLPGAIGKTLKVHRVATANTFVTYKGTFTAQKGDTVYAVRKGTVAALPDMEKSTDRILKNTLEVRHADGTIAVYSNVYSTVPLVRYGDKVFPGQPIGIVGELDFLRVNVFRFLEEGKLAPIEMKYAVNESTSMAFHELDETVVEHPVPVIEKELTDREIKKFRKGNLYPIAKE